MKFFILSIILAASTALAAPSSLLTLRQNTCNPNTQPSVDEAAGAIRDWLVDVNMVNAFVDNVSQASSSSAAHALQFAKNEPNHMKVLSRICGVTDAYTGAVQDLGKVFGGVLTGLQSIVDKPEGSVAPAATINRIRCCNVLRDLDVLWLGAAESYGIVGQIQTNVPRPAACASVNC